LRFPHWLFKYEPGNGAAFGFPLICRWRLDDGNRGLFHRQILLV